MTVTRSRDAEPGHRHAPWRAMPKPYEGSRMHKGMAWFDSEGGSAEGDACAIGARVVAP